MSPEEFVAEAKRRGYGKEETRARYNELMAQGAFDQPTEVGITPPSTPAAEIPKEPIPPIIEKNPFVAPIETGMAIGSGIGNLIAGGYRGLYNAFTDGLDAGVNSINQQMQNTYQPQTESGQMMTEGLMGFMEEGEDVVQASVGGLLGLGDVLTGRGLDQAVQTIQNVQDQGVGAEMGQRVEAAGGSPELATAAHMMPATIESIAGLGGMRSAPNMMRRVDEATATPSTSPLRPMQQQRMDEITQGSTRNELAGWRVERDQNTGAPRRVVPDPAAREAIRQGVPEGVVQAIKQAHPEDRAKMMRMLDIKDRAYHDATYALTNRASDVVGETILEPFNNLMNINRNAARRLNKVAEDLKGETINYDPAIARFRQNLDDMGVKWGDDNRLIYEGSDIEGLEGVQSVLNNVVRRMRDTKVPDAYDVHRMKRFIDENVTYGKMQGGFSGNADRIVKQLRHDLNTVLQERFPMYRAANTEYADTIGVIDRLQELAGTKVDLTGDYGNQAAGMMARKIGSNYQSRIPLIQTLDDIDNIMLKYTGEGIPRAGGGNYRAQLMFANAMDELFGASGQNTFKGQIESAIKSVKRSPREVLVDEAAQRIEDMRGINDERAFEALRNLLQQEY